MKITKRKCNGVLADMVAEQMSYHNTDIAACGHATCPSRESCLRWVLGRRMDDYQAFGLFTPKGGKCKYYRWTQERADDAVISSVCKIGKNENSKKQKNEH